MAMKTAGSKEKVIVYALLSSHYSTTVKFSPVVADFDRNKGYAAKPGYIDAALQVLRGEREPFEIPFRAPGHRFEDFVDGTIIGQYFVSARFEEALVKEGATGYRLREETIVSNSGAQLAYKRLIVTGRCGKLYEPNEYKLDYPWQYQCLGDPPDGSDFFVPEGTGGVSCTQKVADIVKRRKLKVTLVPCELKLR